DKEIQQAEGRISQLKHALETAQGELEERRKLLQTRSAELRDAQVFLTAVDDASDSEVVGIVERLNSHIFQAATGIADKFQGRYVRGQDGPLVKPAYHAVEKLNVFTKNLLSALSQVDHTKDATLAQTALQATMALYAQHLCTSCGSCSGAQSTLFQNIYRSVRESEPQSVAGRWRAITWKHFQSLHPRLDEVQQEACAHLAERIVDILALCGVCGTRVAILNDVIVGFSSPLHDVVKLAFYLEKTITERVISRDLVVVVIQADATFDAAGMVDEWSSPKTVVRASAGSVLCTTQLGMTR
ncbi:hypothetical protein C8Q70DRAFT_880260, partial [Cubamyces menziesii]